MVTVAVWCSFAVVLTHDKLKFPSAYKAVLRWSLAHGIPREQIEAGMPDDGWFEISNGHPIHDARITYPAGANIQRPLTADQRACHGFGLWMFPDLHPVYAITSWTSPCYEQEPIHTETVSFWMRPSLTAYLYRYIPSQRMP